MTTQQTPSVTQEDALTALGQVRYVLKSMERGGDQSQALPWMIAHIEGVEQFILARHREAAEAASEAREDALREALENLANREQEYRIIHDTKGDGSREAGRAWDLMRRAGDNARAALTASNGGEG